MPGDRPKSLHFIKMIVASLLVVVITKAGASGAKETVHIAPNLRTKICHRHPMKSIKIHMAHVQPCDGLIFAHAKPDWSWNGGRNAAQIHGADNNHDFLQSCYCKYLY